MCFNFNPNILYVFLYFCILVCSFLLFSILTCYVKKYWLI